MFSMNFIVILLLLNWIVNMSELSSIIILILLQWYDAVWISGNKRLDLETQFFADLHTLTKKFAIQSNHQYS